MPETQNPTDKNSLKSSLLYRSDQSYFKFENILNLIGGLFILGTVLLGGAQVALRFFFNSQVDGYVDIVEQLMVVFAFAGIAFCQRTNGHIRMEILLNKMHGRFLWWVEFITTSLTSIILLVFVIGAYKHFERSFVRGDSTPDIEIDLWYSKLFVVLALVTLLLRYILQTFAYGRLVANPDSETVAVPETLTDEVAEFGEYGKTNKANQDNPS